MEKEKKIWSEDINSLFDYFQTSKQGLSEEEAARRLKENGLNALDEVKPPTLLARFFAQLKDAMIIVLLAAALISGILAIVQKEYVDLVDTALILLIVIVNAVIAMTQESNADKALKALRDDNKPYIKVLRDGEITKVLSEELVVGDVIVLEAGDVITADVRLIESISLKVEEAALTGESVPIEKHSLPIDEENVSLGDRKNMCHSTGIVSYGRGKALVVKTGMNTEVGKIAQMLAKEEEVTTPLQKQLDKSAKVISIAILIIAAVIFIAGVALKDKNKPVIDAVIFSFMSAVAIAVAAIPEGLPAIVTIVMSIGVKSMSKRNAIVANLPSVETLGGCQVICSDKTGTLTLNKMTVVKLYTFDSGAYDSTEEEISGAKDVLLRTMLLCNDAQVAGDSLLGDPTETALVAYGKEKNKLNYIEDYTRVDENPFDSKRKMMSTINLVGDEKTAHIKGAVDVMLENCKYILDGSKIREISQKDKNQIMDANVNMAKEALRVLGFAIKKANESGVLEKDQLEKDMIFVGLSGMIDPPRKEVKQAVSICKKAGILPIMITGDHIETAKAIAKEIGILAEDDFCITGLELDKMSDAELLEKIESIHVYARVSPENKVRVVKAFQAKGMVTAMTGDGVNDAPALKIADIGVGMGITGTDVSKGVADIVLADDNFATIVSAVEEGRKVYSNIKKAIYYLLSANVAEVLSMFVVAVILSAITRESIVFLSPVMILWINLATDSLPALALGVEKTEADVMDEPPRQAGRSLFAGQYGLNIIIHGLLQSILVLAAYSIGEYSNVGTGNHGEAMTMAFLTLCLIQLFHAYNARSDHNSLFKSNPFENKFMNLSFVIGLVLVVFAVAIPKASNVLFDTVPLNITQWAVALALSILIIPLVEIHKIFIRQQAKKVKQEDKLKK